MATQKVYWLWIFALAALAYPLAFGPWGWHAHSLRNRVLVRCIDRTFYPLELAYKKGFTPRIYDEYLNLFRPVFR